MSRAARKYSLEGRREVFLISFPKCGRTWLRVMLGRALQRHFGVEELPSYRKLLKLERLAKLHPDLPLIRVTHDDYPHWKRGEELERDKSRYAQRPVILLIRDPRDVIVSLYHEQRLRVGDYLERLREKEELTPYRDRLRAYEGSMSEFLREPVGSFDVLLTSLDIWASALPGLQHLLVLRYEDIKTDAASALRRTLELCEVFDVDEAVIEEAIEFSAFDNLRRQEQLGSFRTHKLRPADNAIVDSYKVRRGKIGGFRDELSADDVDYLEAQMSARLSPTWGYNPARVQVSA